MGTPGIGATGAGETVGAEGAAESRLPTREQAHDSEFIANAFQGMPQQAVLDARRRATALFPDLGTAPESTSLTGMLQALPVEVAMAIIAARGESDRIFFETWADSIAHNAAEDQRAAERADILNAELSETHRKQLNVARRFARQRQGNATEAATSDAWGTVVQSLRDIHHRYGIEFDESLLPSDARPSAVIHVAQAIPGDPSGAMRAPSSVGPKIGSGWT